MKNIFMKNLIFILALVFFSFFDVEAISASYSEVCNKGTIEYRDGYLHNCSNENIFLMEEDRANSSYLVASRSVNSKEAILYAGKIDNIDTFYSLGFFYYGVSYDDRGLFSSDMNTWTVLSINGEVVYSGEFEDSLIDDSERGFIGYYNEIGVYLIRQYVDKKVTKVIKMIVVREKDVSLDIIEAKLGEENLSNAKIASNNYELYFKIGGGEYGYGNEVKLTINNCEVVIPFSREFKVASNETGQCLNKNDTNTIVVTLYNGFEMSKKFSYKFKLISENISIKLENSVSTMVTSSRRVIINATAGIGNTLDQKYNLYYWSKSANDKLTYTDFMKNYESSTNKGEYVSNKGVILRDDDGSYYLYALAKDEDSFVVVRSDEYVIQNSEKLNKIIFEDVILVAFLLVGAALPIIIYLFIRVKETK